MKKNVGGIDKILRFILGITAVLVGFRSHSGWAQNHCICGSCGGFIYRNLRLLTPLEGTRD